MTKFKSYIESKIPHFASALSLIVGAAILSHFLPAYSHGLMFSAGMLMPQAIEFFKQKLKRK